MKSSQLPRWRNQTLAMPQPMDREILDFIAWEFQRQYPQATIMVSALCAQERYLKWFNQFHRNRRVAQRVRARWLRKARKRASGYGVCLDSGGFGREWRNDDYEA